MLIRRWHVKYIDVLLMVIDLSQHCSHEKMAHQIVHVLQRAITGSNVVATIPTYMVTFMEQCPWCRFIPAPSHSFN